MTTAINILRNCGGIGRSSEHPMTSHPLARHVFFVSFALPHLRPTRLEKKKADLSAKPSELVRTRLGSSIVSVSDPPRTRE
jgi:hypothetical protein